jgi:AcrR family transcriptional regulator
VSATPSAGTEVRPTGRPRNPELDAAILDAVLELLAEEGYERMSVESVAQRAGVGKPTIYRRWRSKPAMVIDALARMHEPIRAPAEGSSRERLAVVLEDLWRHASEARADRTPLLSHLIGEIGRNPELRDAVRSAFLAKRRGVVAEIVREGISSGEIGPDVDVEVATDMLLSPLFARKLIAGGTISPGVGRQIVDLLFDGCAARA